MSEPAPSSAPSSAASAAASSAASSAASAPERTRRIAPVVSLVVAVVIASLFIVLAGGSSGQNETIESFLIGRPAPAAVSTTLDEQPFDLSRRKGSWVVLNFFDPDCVPCRNEHPELVAFAAQQDGLADGAELYTIVNRGTDDAVRGYFRDNGGDWPVVRDPAGAISVAFGVSQVPETWIIDPNGVIVQRIAGEVTNDFLGPYLQQLREAAGR